MNIEAIGSQQGPDQLRTVQKQHTLVGMDLPDKTFSETLKESIQKVNDIQMEADQAIVDLTTGRKQDLHQTMIAIEKADVSFQLMMQVRNKIIAAYEEVSRMQI